MFLLALYAILLYLELPIEEIRTFMFAALSLGSIFFAFSFKSLQRPLWRINPFTNRYLLLALFSSMALLLGALSLGLLQKLLSLTQLSITQGLALVGIGLFNLFVIEITKYFIFERRLTAR
jgi:Ca2+-transporting ATPase